MSFAADSRRLTTEKARWLKALFVDQWRRIRNRQFNSTSLCRGGATVVGFDLKAAGEPWSTITALAADRGCLTGNVTSEADVISAMEQVANTFGRHR